VGAETTRGRADGRRVFDQGSVEPHGRLFSRPGFGGKLTTNSNTQTALPIAGNARNESFYGPARKLQ